MSAKRTRTSMTPGGYSTGRTTAGKRARRRLIQQPRQVRFHSTAKKAKKRETLTGSQKEALKKMISEEIRVVDAGLLQVGMSRTLTRIDTPAAGGIGYTGALYSLAASTESADPLSRNGDSIRALNFDLRICVTFNAAHQQIVRLMVVQFDDSQGVAPASLLEDVGNAGFPNEQPLGLIQSYYKRNPTSGKFRIIADLTMKSDNNPLPFSAAGPAVTMAPGTVNKFTRVFHKFKESHSRMEYPSNTLGQPVTNPVFIFAGYAQATDANGNQLQDRAPLISWKVRQRFMA